MKKFETPEIETIEFAVEDVITASSLPESEEGDLGGGQPL